MCYRFVKPTSKYNHFLTNIRKDFDKRKHIKLAIENPDLNNIVRAFFEYTIQRKKNDYYLTRCEFKLVLNDYQNCPYVTSESSVNKTMNP